MDEWPKREVNDGQLVLDVAEYDLKQANRRISSFVSEELAPSSRRAYQADLRDFGKWCSKKGLRALPARAWTVADYLAALAETGKYKAATLERRATAIRQAHRMAEVRSPFDTNAKLKRFVQGLVEELDDSPEKKTSIGVTELRMMVTALEDDCEARLLRDRALLLVGFLGAFGRSELVGLQVDELASVKEARGSEFSGLPKRFSADQALAAWVEKAGLTAGPVFRPIDRWGNIQERALSGRSVARIIKKAAQFAGFDPAEFAGLSLRPDRRRTAAAASETTTGVSSDE